MQFIKLQTNEAFLRHNKEIQGRNFIIIKRAILKSCYKTQEHTWSANFSNYVPNSTYVFRNLLEVINAVLLNEPSHSYTRPAKFRDEKLFTVASNKRL